MLRKKSISLLLAVIYFATNVAFASAPESQFWAERKTHLAPSASASTPSLVASLPAVRPALSELRVPASLQTIAQTVPALNATIQDIFPVKEPTHAPVILIQDVHLNAEAQTNIAAVLENFLTPGRVAAIGVEGAFDVFDFAPFRSFSADVRNQVSRSFLENNLLAAPSYAGIVHDGNLPAMVGVDDLALYEKNVDAYLASRAVKAKALADVAQLRETLAKRKREIFSRDLARFDALREEYFRGHLGLAGYVAALAQLQKPTDAGLTRFLEVVALESKLDFAQADRELHSLIERLLRNLTPTETSVLMEQALAHKAGRLSAGAYYAWLQRLCRDKAIAFADSPALTSYFRYVQLVDDVRASELFAALDRWESDLTEKLAKTDGEKELLSDSRRAALLDKLLDFSLSPREWKRYLALSGERDHARWQVFEDFYRAADARSERMVEKLLRCSNADKPLILVAGGFHTERIAGLLREQRIPFVVVAPKLTRVDTASGSAYLSIFAQTKTPLDELFHGEELFMSPMRVQAPDPRLIVRWLGSALLRTGTRVWAGLTMRFVITVKRTVIEIRVTAGGMPAEDDTQPETKFEFRLWPTLYRVVLLASLLWLMTYVPMSDGTALAALPFVFVRRAPAVMRKTYRLERAYLRATMNTSIARPDKQAEFIEQRFQALSAWIGELEQRADMIMVVGQSADDPNRIRKPLAAALRRYRMALIEHHRQIREAFAVHYWAINPTDTSPASGWTEIGQPVSKMIAMRQRHAELVAQITHPSSPAELPDLINDRLDIEDAMKMVQTDLQKAAATRLAYLEAGFYRIELFAYSEMICDWVQTAFDDAVMPALRDVYSNEKPSKELDDALAKHSGNMKSKRLLHEPEYNPQQRDKGSVLRYVLLHTPWIRNSMHEDWAALDTPLWQSALFLRERLDHRKIIRDLVLTLAITGVMAAAGHYALRLWIATTQTVKSVNDQILTPSARTPSSIAQDTAPPIVKKVVPKINWPVLPPAKISPSTKDEPQKPAIVRAPGVGTDHPAALVAGERATFGTKWGQRPDRLVATWVAGENPEYLCERTLPILDIMTDDADPLPASPKEWTFPVKRAPTSEFVMSSLKKGESIPYPPGCVLVPTADSKGNLLRPKVLFDPKNREWIWNDRTMSNVRLGWVRDTDNLFRRVEVSHTDPLNWTRWQNELPEEIRAPLLEMLELGEKLPPAEQDELINWIIHNFTYAQNPLLDEMVANGESLTRVRWRNFMDKCDGLTRTKIMLAMRLSRPAEIMVGLVPNPRNLRRYSSSGGHAWEWLGTVDPQGAIEEVTRKVGKISTKINEQFPREEYKYELPGDYEFESHINKFKQKVQEMRIAQEQKMMNIQKSVLFSVLETTEQELVNATDEDFPQAIERFLQSVQTFPLDNMAAENGWEFHTRHIFSAFKYLSHRLCGYSAKVEAAKMNFYRAAVAIQQKNNWAFKPAQTTEIRTLVGQSGDFRIEPSHASARQTVTDIYSGDIFKLESNETPVDYFQGQMIATSRDVTARLTARLVARNADGATAEERSSPPYVYQASFIHRMTPDGPLSHFASSEGWGFVRGGGVPSETAQGPIDLMTIPYIFEDGSWLASAATLNGKTTLVGSAAVKLVPTGGTFEKTFPNRSTYLVGESNNGQKIILVLPGSSDGDSPTPIVRFGDLPGAISDQAIVSAILIKDLVIVADGRFIFSAKIGKDQWQYFGPLARDNKMNKQNYFSVSRPHFSAQGQLLLARVQLSDTTQKFIGKFTEVMPQTDFPSDRTHSLDSQAVSSDGNSFVAAFFYKSGETRILEFHNGQFRTVSVPGDFRIFDEDGTWLAWTPEKVVGSRAEKCGLLPIKFSSLRSLDTLDTGEWAALDEEKAATPPPAAPKIGRDEFENQQNGMVTTTTRRVTTYDDKGRVVTSEHGEGSFEQPIVPNENGIRVVRLPDYAQQINLGGSVLRLRGNILDRFDTKRLRSSTGDVSVKLSRALDGSLALTIVDGDGRHIYLEKSARDPQKLDAMAVEFNLPFHSKPPAYRLDAAWNKFFYSGRLQDLPRKGQYPLDHFVSELAAFAVEKNIDVVKNASIKDLTDLFQLVLNRSKMSRLMLEVLFRLPHEKALQVINGCEFEASAWREAAHSYIGFYFHLPKKQARLINIPILFREQDRARAQKLNDLVAAKLPELKSFADGIDDLYVRLAELGIYPDAAEKEFDNANVDEVVAQLRMRTSPLPDRPFDVELRNRDNPLVQAEGLFNNARWYWKLWRPWRSAQDIREDAAWKKLNAELNSFIPLKNHATITIRDPWSQLRSAAFRDGRFLVAFVLTIYVLATYFVANPLRRRDIVFLGRSGRSTRRAILRSSPWLIGETAKAARVLLEKNDTGSVQTETEIQVFRSRLNTRQQAVFDLARIVALEPPEDGRWFQWMKRLCGAHPQVNRQAYNRGLLRLARETRTNPTLNDFYDERDALVERYGALDPNVLTAEEAQDRPITAFSDLKRQIERRMLKISRVVFAPPPRAQNYPDAAFLRQPSEGGGERFDMRAYTPSDGVHRINWAAYLRTDRYHVNRTQREVKRPMVPLLDLTSDPTVVNTDVWTREVAHSLVLAMGMFFGDQRVVASGAYSFAFLMFRMPDGSLKRFDEKLAQMPRDARAFMTVLFSQIAAALAEATKDPALRRTKRARLNFNSPAQNERFAQRTRGVFVDRKPIPADPQQVSGLDLKNSSVVFAGVQNGRMELARRLLRERAVSFEWMGELRNIAKLIPTQLVQPASPLSPVRSKRSHSRRHLWGMLFALMTVGGFSSSAFGAPPRAALTREARISLALARNDVGQALYLLNETENLGVAQPLLLAPARQIFTFVGFVASVFEKAEKIMKVNADGFFKRAQSVLRKEKRRAIRAGKALPPAASPSALRQVFASA